MRNPNNILIPYLETLLNDGFEVFVYQKEENDPSWAIFGKDGKVGYVQADYWRGLSFCTVHKANKDTGTGFRVFEGVGSELEYAYETMRGRPDWAHRFPASVSYSGIAEYVEKSYLKYIPFVLEVNP